LADRRGNPVLYFLSILDVFHARGDQFLDFRSVLYLFYALF
jgi:hypothetical protein